MSSQPELLGQLLDATHEGLVFGRGIAFGELDADRRLLIARQTHDIIKGANQELVTVLAGALPEAKEQEVQGHVRQVTTKAAGFVSALTGGELVGDDNMHWLILSVLSTCDMYLTDHLTDRGDVWARLAVERHAGKGAHIHPAHRDFVDARSRLLTHIQDSIGELAAEGDAPHITDCFIRLVLHNEAELQGLSDTYIRTPDTERAAFLEAHAQHIGDLMVADAGFQSVTSVLHTIYRRNDPTLPTIEELHAHPDIAQTIQVCNAVARVADERGDWWMDAGNDIRYGVFSINPFNQYNETLINRLCELAGITDQHETAEIRKQFRAFNMAGDDETRNRHGGYITDRFFGRMREQIASLKQTLPPETYQRFSRYITLCMRVGEISYVNMVGDIHMAGEHHA